MYVATKGVLKTLLVKTMIKAASAFGAAFFIFTPFNAVAEDAPGPSVQRIIHEAENLSLNRDRNLACGVLWRNIKRADKTDAKILRDKLFQLSRYYYTDKGFQASVVGKELFQKQKYQDAADKLAEADDLEAGNVEVLHFLTLSKLWLKKFSQAETVNRRALQICPIDMDLQRDLLAVAISQERWPEALTTAETLNKEYNDYSAQTLQSMGVALFKRDMKAEAKKALEQALAKDPHLPETYYWLASLKDDKDSLKFLTKYMELCKNKSQPGQLTNVPTGASSEREIYFCSHLPEVEKKVGS